MNKPFEFNDEVKPIALDTSLDWAAGQTFTVTGWGSTFVSFEFKNLLRFQVKYFFVNFVEVLYNTHAFSRKIFFREKMI